MTTRALAVRARVTPRAGAHDPLFDPLVDDLVHGGPLARERLATAWGDTAALAALADAKRRPLAEPLARELLDYHRRLGAAPASLANLERLARGEAVATVAGQQPAPLGGPLYSLHKIAGAVGLAAAVRARTGAACVPLYWMHGEDSDFAEIRGVSVFDAALTREALAAWAGLPGAADAEAAWARAAAHARDLGEATSALVLALFAGEGVVVVDPRLPAFRAAARPILERYLADAGALHAAARRAGDRLEALAGRRPLADAALESFVFALDDGRRRKVTPAAAGAARALSPSVALRPAVQDGVFPTVAMACGPGEIAYLMQLREVFEGVGVRAAAPAPRFSATWLPAAALELVDAAGGEPWSVVSAADAAIAAVAARRVPAELAAALARARGAALEALARFAEGARGFDAGLPQLVESAQGKVDYQFARLHEGLLAKARARLDREHPAWRRLRYVLLPGDKLQERRLASLEPVARRGAGVVAELCELAGEHAARAAAGEASHLLLEA